MNAASRRVSTLAVGNRYPDNESTARSGSDDSGSPERRLQDADSSLTLKAGQDHGEEVLRRPSEATLTLKRRSTTTNEKHESLQSPPEAQPQKRKSGVFGFLALKEPSTSAWEGFAEQERKKAAARGGARPTAVGLPGVSSQKLPEHVPRVNSKWNGLPNTAKKKTEGRRSKETSRPNRNSTRSTWTGRSHYSTTSVGSQASGSYVLYGSVSSKVSRPRSFATAPISHSAVPSSVSSGAIAASQRVSSTHALTSPKPTKSPQTRPLTFLHPPSPPPALPHLGYLLAQQDRPLLELPDLPELADTSRTAASSEPSPQTTGGALQLDHHPEVNQVWPGSSANQSFWMSDSDDALTSALRKTKIGPSASAACETPNWPFPASEVAELPSSEDSDRSLPKTILKERPRPAPLHPLVRAPPPRRAFFDASYATATTPITDMSPTYSKLTQAEPYTRPTTSASTVHAPSLSPISYNDRHDVDSTGDECSDVPRSGSIDSMAPGVAPSVAPSIAPSVISARWSMTPKERLGLGSRVTSKAEVLPWETEPTFDDDGGKPKREPSRQKKRFSLMSRK